MKSFVRSIVLNSLLLSFIYLIFFFFAFQPAYAQSANDVTINANSSKIGLSAVYSPNSFAAWGKIRNSTSFTLKGQIWITQFNLMNLNARFGSEIIFSQHLNYPLNGLDGPRDQRLGFGLIPAKILIPFGSSTVKPFGFFSAGLLFLNERLPAGDGASLNYLLNIGTGLEFSVTNSVALQIGYSIQHLSNANSAGQNPGIDYHNLFFTIIL